MIYDILANFSIRHAKAVILIWICFLLFFGLFAVKLPNALKGHGLKVDGSYAKVQSILSSDFHMPDNPVILLFEKQKQVSQKQFHVFITTALDRMQEIEGLHEVLSPLSKAEMEAGNLAYALLSFDQEDHDLKPVIARIQQLLPKDSHMSVKLTGKPVVQEDVNKASQSDLQKAEMIGVPIAFVVLLLSFGGLISSLLPILVGLIGVTGTMGIMYLLGTRLELSIFVLNVIPMVGLALSIDFALMLVSRFREELREHSVQQALPTAMRTAGRAVIFSALCVLLGLAGMLYIRMPIFYTVALGAMIVLVISVLLTLTLLPALLSIMGSRIQIEARARFDTGRTSLWLLASAYVIKRPIRICLLASLALIGCIMPLSQMEVAVPDAGSLPKGYESREAAEQFSRHFTTASGSRVFLIKEGEGAVLQKKDWAAAYEVVQKLKRNPDVIRVDSIFSQHPLSAEEWDVVYRDAVLKKKFAAALEPFVQGKRILIAVTLYGDASSKQVKDWVREFEAASLGSSLLIGGEPKYEQEVYDEVFTNIGRVLRFIIASNFIILFIAFRSILIPIKTIFMNLMSLGAAFGILVLVFEKGVHGIEPSSIAIMIPVFIFGLTFGISMDYGVFLLSRIAEIYRRTGDNDLSIQEGLASTSQIITSAAAIMIAVTAPFAFGEVSGVKQLGVGIAAAILIDATVVRMMLVPSLMKMLGKWNWWAP
ncbi:MMPL family transporter [Paenibacillus eucommiae]|uniref:RND superfamily putative drug exporter n=1 Tax=Paenibacillus eucommiae TaxID=1355755 RepID=A0ABS4J255_9BACL|nr:MMPL family transporter [Paenibacillus eucommiae]MBP1993919.1 RND superfamily putative drug exporter [Paenibacillus eucommiae]